MRFDAYRPAGPLSFVPRLESRKKVPSQIVWDQAQRRFAPYDPLDAEAGQPIEPLDATLELPTKRSTVHNLPYRIRVRYRVHFKNGSLRDFSRAWALDNLQEWQPSMPNPGAANPEVRIAPMTPDEEQRLLVAIDEAMAKHGSHLAGFGADEIARRPPREVRLEHRDFAREWGDFFVWLEANGVRYFNGDIHYAGRGYWYPEPPVLAMTNRGDALPGESTGTLLPERFVSVEQDRNATAVFVTTQLSTGRDSGYFEDPRAAKTAVENALMAFDQDPAFSGLGSNDEGISSQCDVGHHVRCRGCECSCHVRKLGSLIGERWDNEIVQCTKCGRQHDPRQWQELKFVGNQPVEADEEGPAYVLEMRNCPCGSTLAIDLK